MVGLSVVLEGYHNTMNNNNKDISTITSGSNWQILNKASMFIKPTSPSTIPSSPFSQRNPPAPSGFLDLCFLCKQKLLPDKDIYMYKGEWAFCSVECRGKQIFMDEQESIKTRKNMKYQALTSSNNKSCTSSSSSSSSSASSRSRKTAVRNRPNGFAH